jgi:hypothetical protein
LPIVEVLLATPKLSLMGMRRGTQSDQRLGWIGGAERDRTADLVIANDALSQLSYSPTIYGGFTPVATWVSTNENVARTAAGGPPLTASDSVNVSSGYP